MRQPIWADLLGGERYAVPHLGRRAVVFARLRVACFAGAATLAVFGGPVGGLMLFVLPGLWWLSESWMFAAGLPGRVVEAQGTLCTHCTQDLRGLGATGICPECGHGFDVDRGRDLWHEDMPRTIMRDGTPFTKEKWEARWKVERPAGGNSAGGGGGGREDESVKQ